MGLKTLHSFTLFQALMLVVLYVLTRINDVAVIFPFFIGLLIFVRKGMTCCWDKDHLNALEGSDDITKTIGGGEISRKRRFTSMKRFSTLTRFPQAINGGITEVHEWVERHTHTCATHRANSNNKLPVEVQAVAVEATPHAAPSSDEP